MDEATLEQSLGLPNTECEECFGYGWTCEQHPGKPWAGIVGDRKGCSPGCDGPGMPCRCRPGAGYPRCLDCGTRFYDFPEGCTCTECGGPVSQQAGTIHVGGVT